MQLESFFFLSLYLYNDVYFNYECYFMLSPAELTLHEVLDFFNGTNEIGKIASS